MYLNLWGKYKVIELNQVSKYFSKFQAVDNLSFQVKKGEVLGFLGPNGAGKSTTMKMITGYLPISAGKITVCGFDLETSKLEAQKVIGYVPENAPLYDDMLVIEFLEFIGSVRGLKDEDLKAKIDHVIEICALGSVKIQKIETLSKGYKRRVSLAQALIHDPQVLILDEPTDGLDPNQKHDMRQLIKILSKEKCILVSTHILEEVEAICSRCIIISHGKKLFDGLPSELVAKSATGKIEDVFRSLTTNSFKVGMK